MDKVFEILTWRPELGGSGETSDVTVLMMVIMSFIGAGVVTRLTKIETSFNFSVNFSVMLIGCFAFRQFGAPILFPMKNEIVASAITANVGMTLAGFVLLLAYRNSNNN